MNKDLYILVHDSNSGLGHLNNVKFYLKKLEKRFPDIAKEKEFELALDFVESGKERIKRAIDEFYKSTKQ